MVRLVLCAMIGVCLLLAGCGEQQAPKKEDPGFGWVFDEVGGESVSEPVTLRLNVREGEQFAYEYSVDLAMNGSRATGSGRCADRVVHVKDGKTTVECRMELEAGTVACLPGGDLSARGGEVYREVATLVLDERGRPASTEGSGVGAGSGMTGLEPGLTYPEGAVTRGDEWTDKSPLPSLTGAMATAHYRVEDVVRTPAGEFALISVRLEYGGREEGVEVVVAGRNRISVESGLPDAGAVEATVRMFASGRCVMAQRWRMTMRRVDAGSGAPPHGV